ncbi:MAG: hypothetical protein WAS56_07895 [Saprospiraceae bacterium]|jgi:preprotein translocase subunit YajC|nr:CcoQ/FixQ family Cbb3-type cytochrome c oxidase assembly chaperone [Saprospiraceae bacterium]MBK8735100.1 CcoQ/FixQ family Cbb3-type cytochrome c oxidase assembly chaperone [Saprospiraceae bacterium]MBK9994734.1 CcoQ/FixQ family Cbb3-type cytochrome c oxidase assembly chaperone [Saprospiraceae bacterium]HOJ91810.1 hypothetical protein [Saprospiraceae bacterium]HUN17467.1 hypothetical protein [Saprospiraceae bacterium]
MKFGTYLEKINNVSIYPIVSLVLFVSFFVLVSFWIFRLDKKEIERVERIPLDEN